MGKWRRRDGGHQYVVDGEVAAIVERTNGGHWIAEVHAVGGREHRMKVWPPRQFAVAKLWAVRVIEGGPEPLGAVETQFILAGPVEGT